MLEKLRERPSDSDLNELWIAAPTQGPVRTWVDRGWKLWDLEGRREQEETQEDGQETLGTASGVLGNEEGSGSGVGSLGKDRDEDVEMGGVESLGKETEKENNETENNVNKEL